MLVRLLVRLLVLLPQIMEFEFDDIEDHFWIPIQAYLITMIEWNELHA